MNELLNQFLTAENEIESRFQAALIKAKLEMARFCEACDPLITALKALASMGAAGRDGTPLEHSCDLHVPDDHRNHPTFRGMSAKWQAPNRYVAPDGFHLRLDDGGGEGLRFSPSGSFSAYDVKYRLTKAGAAFTSDTLSIRVPPEHRDALFAAILSTMAASGVTTPQGRRTTAA